MLVYQRVTFTAEPGRLKSGWILVDCWPHSWGALVHQGWKLSLGTWDCLWDDWDGVSPFFSSPIWKKLPEKRGQPEKSPGWCLHMSTALIELSLHSYVWFMATSLDSHFEGPPTIQLSKEPIGPISEPMRAITGKARDACAEQPAS